MGIISILFCVEKGFLEQQAKLLVKSLMKFSASSKLQLIAFSPRCEFYPSKEMCDFFANNDVIHIKKDLNTDYLDYPIANKVIACDYVENNFPQSDSLIFVDTDTVFLNSISNDLTQPKNKLYLRPVDNKGPGSEGIADKNDGFWQNVYQLFGLALPKAFVTTTVRPHLIRPYYNAGFICACGLAGFFTQWKKDFDKLVDSGLRPFAYQSRDNTDFRCLDQVALAVTTQRFADKVEVLPEAYNYPIPFRPILNQRANHPKFHELVHVHYHKWFQHPDFLDYVTDDKEKQSEQYLWLQKHLPLLPKIDGDFKS
jgi:lipopolysaccharide biosynthesis glycosyltransferase